MRSTLIGSVAACAAIAVITVIALRQSNEPARCPEGLTATGARCCGQDQAARDGHCTGDATACITGMTLVGSTGQRQCEWQSRGILVSGGSVQLGPSDWEAEGVLAPHLITVSTFVLDDSEVTWGRYLDCASRGDCASVILSTPSPLERGLPITQVSPQQAAQLCVALGGRLPTGDEWVFAAAGVGGRRYPWGATGLVCRRAAFGLTNGPCGQGGSLPDLVGTRPDGANELGLQDLAGNVAEWTREPDGFRARGGSFSSNVAGQLKSWASVAVTTPALDIGFRCAYDHR